jgi:hypothetical protein
MAGLACMTAVLPAFAGDKALAEDLFRKAQSVMQRPKTTKDEIHQACQWFKESYDQDPTQNTQVALGACWEKEGKNRSAWGMYTDAASGSGPAAAYAKERADALYKLGFLKLKIETKDLPDGATVMLDGESVGNAILNTEINADPGDHKLDVKAPGKKDFQKKFELTAQSSPLTVSVVLEDAPVVTGGGGGGGGGVTIAPPPETSPVRTLGIIIGVAGLAAGAGALVSEILAQVFDGNKATLQGRGDMIGAKEQSDKAHGAQSAAIGLGIAGGALVVTGIVLYFVGAPKKAETPKATWHFAPTVGPQGAGGFLVGSF